MLLRFFVSLGVVVAVAGCASPAPVRPDPGPVTATWQQEGTILAVRPIPAAIELPVRLGWPGADQQQSGSEVIVKLDDGGTLAVVQPGPPALHVGQRVGVLRGEPTRLIALSNKLASR